MANKKIDKTPVAVWEVERKRVETVAKLDEFWALMKMEFTNLQKLRFPLILRVSRPVEDVKGAIFAETEPVSMCLGGILEGAFALDELEVKLGLIQICEALNFVHSTAQMVHLNLNPWSIMICGSDWKLAGFGFSTLQSVPPQKPYFDPVPLNAVGSHTKKDVKVVGLTSPSLNFSAPEVVFMNSVSTAADMFALGCLIYRLYWACAPDDQRIKPESNHHIIYSTSSVDVYRQQLSRLPTVSLNHIPASLRPTVELLLSSDPSLRPTAEDVLKTDYFNDTSLKILQYLAHINEHDDRDKAEFLKGLKIALENLNSFSSKILRQKLLPPLIAELRNTILVPLVLPNIFTIIEMIEKAEKTEKIERTGIFATMVLPELKPLVTIREPLQISVILLQRLEFISKRIPESNASSHLAPIVYSGLDHPNGAVVVLALKELLNVLPFIEHESIRTELTPRVLSLIHNPQTPQVTRVQSLFTMSKLIPFAARPFTETSIIPAVLHTLTIDRSPTTITGVVGVCDVISLRFGTDFTAHRLLPPLIPLLVDSGLGRKQFDTTLTILNGMISRIAEAKKKAFDEIEARSQPATALDGASDAQKLQAFSAQLPPISSSISSSNASTAAHSRQHTSSPSLAAGSTTTKSPSPPPVLQPSTSSAQGAAAFNAVIYAQNLQKKALQEQKEASTLVDTFDQGGAEIKAAPAFDSDLLSLDMSAFNSDSIFHSTPTPTAVDSGFNSAPLYPSITAAPTVADPNSIFYSSTTPSFTAPSLMSWPTTSSYADNTTPNASYDDDDLFNPRA